MNTDSKLFLSTPASRHLPSAELDVSTVAASGAEEHASERIKLDDLFGSIFHMQLRGKTILMPHGSISLPTNTKLLENSGNSDLATTDVDESTASEVARRTKFRRATDEIATLENVLEAAAVEDQVETATIASVSNTNQASADAPETRRAAVISTYTGAEANQSGYLTSTTPPVDEFEKVSSINSKPIQSTSLAESAMLEPQVKTRQAGDSPLAGSPTTLSDEVTQSARQLNAVEQLSVTTSEQTQWSGKPIPPSGTMLPGNLLFLTKPNIGTSNLLTSDVSTAMQKDLYPNLQIQAYSDLMAKSVTQSQQSPISGDSQSAPQGAAQLEATLTVPGILTPGNIEKAGTGRSFDIFNTGSVTNFTIGSPVGSSDWNNQLENKIRWMNRVNISSAQLTLHPAELGTIEIKISTEDDQTKVSFLTNNVTTKEIIEASLPRLRDLLSSSGLQLEQSEVSHRNPSDNSENQQEPGPGDIVSEALNVVNENSSRSGRRSGPGQIDQYV